MVSSSVYQVGFFGPLFLWVEMNVTETEVAERVEALAEPLLRLEGLELVEVQYRREQPGWVLRLFIDRAPDPALPPGSGVTLDDCVAVSREIGRLLDVEDVIDGPYNLEVSSPGLDRPLTKPTDYQRFAGRKVRIKMRTPEGRRTVTGRLIGLENGQIRVESQGRDEAVSLESADRVQLEPEFNQGQGSK